MVVIMSNKLYDILKWIALVALDAIALLYQTIAAIWNLPFAEQIPATIIAISVCLGTFLGISSIKYNKADDSK